MKDVDREEMRKSHYMLAHSVQPEGIFELWEHKTLGDCAPARLTIFLDSNRLRIIGKTYSTIYEAIEAYREGSYIS